MKFIRNSVRSFLQRTPHLVIAIRWWVLGLFIISTCVMTYGLITRFNMDMALESWFQDDDPAKLALDEFRHQFGSDDGIYIVYRAKDGDVFSKSSLETLFNLQQALDNARIQPRSKSELTRIQRIDSLINVRYQIAQGDTIISRQLVGQQFPQTAAELTAIKQIALKQRAFPLAYYSRDHQYGGIRIKTDFGTIPKNSTMDRINSNTKETALDEMAMESWFETADDVLEVTTDATVTNIEYEDTQMDEYLTFMKDLRAITEQSNFEHFEFFYVGNPPMMEFAMESMAQSAFLLLGMIALVILLLWGLFRTFSAVLWSVLVIIASAIWSVGFVSWLGIELSNMVSLTFTLILAVGIADCVHVFSSYIYALSNNNHQQAITYAYRKTGVAILLTTITTMAGMLTLASGDIPQITVFGWVSALGVGMAFVFTLFLLPALLDIWHPKVNVADKRNYAHHSVRWLQPFLDRIPAFVTPRYHWIVMLYVIILIFCGYSLLQVKVDSNFAELTREGSPIRVSYEVVDEQMMGSNNMEIMLDFKQSDALKKTAVLQAIDQLQQKLHHDYPELVLKTFSMVDFVKETHQIMFEGKEDEYRLPMEDLLTAQLLYLFNNANAEDRRQLVSDDYAQTHLSVQLKNMGSYGYTQFFIAVRQDIENIFGDLKSQYPELEIEVTGSLALMMSLIEHMSWAQIKSFSLALGIISLLMMITLGSVQAGLIAMIPNLLPAVFTFGVMGWLDIPLDTDTLIIAPLIIGIAVDDTIHFMVHYREAWLETGDVDQALANTIKEVGQAVTFTTLILGCGFFMLSFSTYLGIAKAGIFGSLAIFVALSSDLIFLPALIKWLRPKFGHRNQAVQPAVLNQ